MAKHAVAAAASWSCCHASHGLSRKVTREQNKCSLGAAAFVVGYKGIIANNAHCFNKEREAVFTTIFPRIYARTYYAAMKSMEMANGRIR
jgi:hypothetical protein